MEQDEVSHQLKRVYEHPGCEEAPSEHDTEQADYPDETCEYLSQESDFHCSLRSNLSDDLPLKHGPISDWFSIRALEKICAPEIHFKRVKFLSFRDTCRKFEVQLDKDIFVVEGLDLPRKIQFLCIRESSRPNFDFECFEDEIPLSLGQLII